jgi:hypothetical protein
MSTEVKVSPYATACYNYVNSEGREKKVSVIIAPIGIERKGDKTVVSWACSKGSTCMNKECRYSKAAHEKGV